MNCSKSAYLEHFLWMVMSREKDVSFPGASIHFQFSFLPCLSAAVDGEAVPGRAADKTHSGSVQCQAPVSPARAGLENVWF